MESHKTLRAGRGGTANQTKLEKLSEIWDRLLPHRRLNIAGDDITVRTPDNATTYPASDLSDGERAVFYLVTQTLVAGEDSVLVIDEPELHLHPSIMTLLWDELGAARPDCAFVFITHSLGFAAARPGDKYVVREYQSGPTWTIDPVPHDSGFSEEVTTLMLGSRRPVLFVEGTASSLDRSIYDACYPDHLVLPLESCDAVIHAVASMRTNAALTRVTCHGIVDGDHRSADDIDYLRGLGVMVLPVAELENVFLLPEVSRAIAAHEGHEDGGLNDRLNALRKAVFDRSGLDDWKRAMVLRHVARQIDRLLKRVHLSAATSVKELEQRFDDNVGSLDVDALASDVEDQIESAIRDEPNRVGHSGRGSFGPPRLVRGHRGRVVALCPGTLSVSVPGEISSPRSDSHAPTLLSGRFLVPAVIRRANLTPRIKGSQRVSVPIGVEPARRITAHGGWAAERRRSARAAVSSPRW